MLTRPTWLFNSAYSERSYTADGLLLNCSADRLLHLHLQTSHSGDCLTVKILKARDVKYTAYANGPRIELLVDEIPKPRDMTYEAVVIRDGDHYSTLYFAEQDGYVS